MLCCIQPVAVVGLESLECGSQPPDDDLSVERGHRKNDQAHVEEKNGSVVRRMALLPSTPPAST